MNHKFMTLWQNVPARVWLMILVLVLMLVPTGALAEKKPGYEDYPDGYEGYLGDGITKAGEDEASELARAVQNQRKNAPPAEDSNPER